MTITRSTSYLVTIMGVVLLGSTAVHPAFRPYLVFLLLNGLVLANAVLLYTNLNRSHTWTDAILGVAILALSQITVTELYLGLAGHLTLRAVFIAQIGCLGLTIAGIRTGWLRAPSSSACRRAVADMIRAGLDVATGSRATILACAVTCCVFAFVFGISSLNPPISFDGLFFHLVQPVEWLQSGHIPIQLMQAYAYPHGIGLITVWLMFPLHHDFLARWSQTLFILLGFLASYGICRRLGVERRLAIVTATAVLVIPEYLANGIALTNPDTQIAGMVLVALNFGLSCVTQYQFGTVLLLALSLGLVLSAKITSLYYGLPLVPLVVYAWYRGQCHREQNPRPVFTALLHATVLVLVPLGVGGITYLYHFMMTHTLYSLNTPFRHAFHLSRFAASPESLRNVGVGVLVGLFGMYGFVKLLRQQQWGNLLLPMFVALPLFFSLFVYAWYGTYIGAQAIRHLLATVALCVILAGWAVAQAGEGGQRYGIWGLVSMVVLSSFVGFLRQWPLHRVPTRIIAAVLAVAGGIVVWRLLEAVQTRRWTPHRFLTIGSSLPVLLFSAWLMLLGLHGWERAYRAHKYETWPTWFGFGNGWEWIGSATATHGARIAHNVDLYPYPQYGRYAPYPLYGYDLQNELILLRPQLTPDESPMQQTQRLMEWEQELIRRQIDYIYLFPIGKGKREIFEIATDWAEAHPETFTPMYYGGTEHIYRVHTASPTHR